MSSLIIAACVVVVGIAAIVAPPFIIWRHELKRRRRYITLHPRIGMERTNRK